MKIQENPLYEAPAVKLVEVKVQTIICQSGGIDEMQRDDDDGGDLFN